MSFRKEPPHTHGTSGKAAVLLVNLGTPEAPTTGAVRRYLRQFLSDRRVVEIPQVIWWFILNGIILPFRASRSAAKYALIWRPEGSPLRVHTERQSAALRTRLQERGHQVVVAHAMRYGQPTISTVLDQLKQDGCDRVLIVPAYPQYSGATTASIFDAVFSHFSTVRNIPELRFIRNYHDHEGYIQALKKSVLAYWDANGMPDKLIMSFHGLPKRALMLGDPYHCECYKTARLLAQQLNLTQDEYLVTFQSRFGKAEWLQPYTAPTLIELARQGAGRVDVMCPGFISDCLETLEEIALEGKQAFLQAGGKEFHFIPCLNEAPVWIDGLRDIVEQQMIGWQTMFTPATLQQQSREAERSLQEATRIGAEH
jgi:protoporphyrin/coproporphyrin ferrochelatase